LPHLRSTENEERGGIDLELELGLRSEKMRAAGSEPARISRGSLREMYWTMAQMVAHHTSNGCNLRPGDLLASGTVSGAEAGSEGCLLERTRSGPIDLPSGEKRTFLVDGDEVIVRAVAVHRGAARIGFGPCAGRIVQSS
jgi:fumarylacetoacetase